MFTWLGMPPLIYMPDWIMAKTKSIGHAVLKDSDIHGKHFRKKDVYYNK
jgi:hypothetical protein